VILLLFSNLFDNSLDVCLLEMQNCTPCIRAMVMQSDCLAVGSLFIITCTGGTIGRDTDLGHSIVIPDPLISKVDAL